MNRTDIVRPVTYAIQNKKKMKLTHKRVEDGGISQDRIIAPYDIKVDNGIEHLYVHCYLHGKTEKKRVANILELTVLKESFDPYELSKGWGKHPIFNIPRNWKLAV